MDNNLPHIPFSNPEFTKELALKVQTILYIRLPWKP